MHPWYKNFRGTVESFGDKYVISGEAAILPGDKIEITELPVGTWTQNYKENVLEPLLGNDKVKPLISEYRVSFLTSSLFLLILYMRKYMSECVCSFPLIYVTAECIWMKL